MNTSQGFDFAIFFHKIINFIVGFGTDFLPFIVTVGVIMAFALYFGRNRLMPLIAAMYAAVVLYVFFPFQTGLLSDNYIAMGLYFLFVFLALTAFSGLSAFMASGER